MQIAITAHDRRWYLQTRFVGRISILAVCLFCVMPLLGCASEALPEEAAAVAMIQRLKGHVEYDGTGSDRHVTKAYLHGTAVEDGDLAEIKRLKLLKSLFLGKTQISDAGLIHLQELTELKTLSLNSTRVSDAGLKSLDKLTSLKTINLQETSVTSTGAAALRKTLPGVTVAR